jgi:hypothetical protein
MIEYNLRGRASVHSSALRTETTGHQFSEFTLENLKALREIIQVEEAREVPIDKTLRHVKEFYHRFAPYS